MEALELWPPEGCDPAVVDALDWPPEGCILPDTVLDWPPVEPEAVLEAPLDWAEAEGCVLLLAAVVEALDWVPVAALLAVTEPLDWRRVSSSEMALTSLLQNCSCFKQRQGVKPTC